MSTYYMTELDRELLSQPEKIISVRMDLLDSDWSLIESLDASLINMSLSIDADSEIRRTGTINIIPEFDGYEIVSKSKLWIDRMVRVYLKYYSNVLDAEAEYCMGTFLIDTKTFTLDEANDSLSVTLVDLMAKLDGTYGGELGQEDVVIPMEEPMYDEYGDPVPKVDDQGNIVYQKDDDGNVIVDPDTGEPIPEQATKPTKIRDAMIKTIALADITDYIIDDIGAYDRENSAGNYTKHFDYTQYVNNHRNWNLSMQYEYFGVYGEEYEQCTENFPYIQYNVMDDGVLYTQKDVLRLNTYDDEGNYYAYAEPMCEREIKRPYAFYYTDDNELVLERQNNLFAEDICRAFSDRFSDEGWNFNFYDWVYSDEYRRKMFIDKVDDIIKKHNVSHIDVYADINAPQNTQRTYYLVMYHNSGNRLIELDGQGKTRLYNSCNGGISVYYVGVTYDYLMPRTFNCVENTNYPELKNIMEGYEPQTLHVISNQTRIYETNFIVNRYSTVNGQIVQNAYQRLMNPSLYGDYESISYNYLDQQKGFYPYTREGKLNIYSSFPIFDSKEHADAFLIDGSIEGLLNPHETYEDSELRYTIDHPYELVYYEGESIDGCQYYYLYAISNDLNGSVTTHVKKTMTIKDTLTDDVMDYAESLIEEQAYERGTYFDDDEEPEPFLIVKNIENKKYWCSNNLKCFDTIEDIKNYITYGKEDGMYDPMSERDTTIPYEITIDGGTCVLDVVKELRDLYPGYETYFDPMGVFHCHLIPTCADDDVTLKAKDFEEDIAVYSEQRNYEYSSVKNVVQVYGEEYEDIDWYADETNSSYEEGTCTLDVDFVKEKFKGYEDGMLLALKLQKANPPGLHINIKGMTPVNTEEPTTPSENSNDEEDPGVFYGATRVMYSIDRNEKLEAGYLLPGVVYVLRYCKGNFEYVSSFQPKGIAILLSEDIDDEDKRAWCKKYNVSDASFVVDPDNPFTTDCINIHYTKNVETRNMQIIRSDEEALDFAEYELWRMGRLPNTITLSIDVVPFLDVNQKIEYKHIRSGETFNYITKNISIDISETSAQASVTATTFNSLYPEIIGNPNRYRHGGGGS